jgi:hypothetical protein
MAAVLIGPTTKTTTTIKKGYRKYIGLTIFSLPLLGYYGH